MFPLTSHSRQKQILSAVPRAKAWTWQIPRNPRPPPKCGSPSSLACTPGTASQMPSLFLPLLFSVHLLHDNQVIFLTQKGACAHLPMRFPATCPSASFLNANDSPHSLDPSSACFFLPLSPPRHPTSGPLCRCCLHTEGSSSHVGVSCEVIPSAAPCRPQLQGLLQRPFSGLSGWAPHPSTLYFISNAKMILVSFICLFHTLTPQ